MALVQQQKFNPSGILTFYDIDFTAIPNFTTSAVLYFSDKKNGTSPITYDSNSYEPTDIVADGFGSELGGSPPEPSLIIGFRDLSENTSFQAVETAWVTTQALGNVFDWRGTKITRTRIFNDDIADTSKAMQDIWYVDRLERIDRFGYYLKLSVGLGIERINDRSVRRMSHAMCSLRYRLPASSTDTFHETADATFVENGGCPWGITSESGEFSHLGTWATVTGVYHTIAEASTSTWSDDACNKTITSCKLRFDPSGAGHPLPFAGLFRTGTKRTKK